MKMEQACRFRTDEAGYMVCARSQGLTADNENNLGYFNSTMTSLFEKDGSGPRMGQSILSYAVSEAGFPDCQIYHAQRYQGAGLDLYPRILYGVG